MNVILRIKRARIQPSSNRDVEGLRQQIHYYLEKGNERSTGGNVVDISMRGRNALMVSVQSPRRAGAMRYIIAIKRV